MHVVGSSDEATFGEGYANRIAGNVAGSGADGLFPFVGWAFWDKSEFSVSGLPPHPQSCARRAAPAARSRRTRGGGEPRRGPGGGGKGRSGGE